MYVCRFDVILFAGLTLLLKGDAVSGSDERPAKVVVAREHEGFKLRCKLVRHTDTFQYRWYFEDIPLKSTKHIKVKSSLQGSVLKIKHVSAEHAGEYLCQISDMNGVTSQMKYKLEVKPACKLCNEQTLCRNGGVCCISDADQSQYCDCKDGYYGRRCDERVAAVINIAAYNTAIAFNVACSSVLTVLLIILMYCWRKSHPNTSEEEASST